MSSLLKMVRRSDAAIFLHSRQLNFGLSQRAVPKGYGKLTLHPTVAYRLSKEKAKPSTSFHLWDDRKMMYVKEEVKSFMESTLAYKSTKGCARTA